LPQRGVDSSMRLVSSSSLAAKVATPTDNRTAAGPSSNPLVLAALPQTRLRLPSLCCAGTASITASPSETGTGSSSVSASASVSATPSDSASTSATASGAYVSQAGIRKRVAGRSSDAVMSHKRWPRVPSRRPCGAARLPGRHDSPHSHGGQCAVFSRGLILGWRGAGALLDAGNTYKILCIPVESAPPEWCHRRWGAYTAGPCLPVLLEPNATGLPRFRPAQEFTLALAASCSG
jgi:hypothetical protein